MWSRRERPPVDHGIAPASCDERGHALDVVVGVAHMGYVPGPDEGVTRSHGNGVRDALGDWLEHRRTCIALRDERRTIEALEREKVEGQRLGFACLVEPSWCVGDECL